MKKIRWSTLSDPEVENFANQVTLKGNFTPLLEVSIITTKDGETKPIERFKDVKVEENKVLLTPKFQWGLENYRDTNPANIEYSIKKADNLWKVNEKEGSITVMPGMKSQFVAARKEMHKKLFKEKFEENIRSDKQDLGTTDMKYNILEDGKGNYKVKVHYGDDANDREFPWEKIEIEPVYFQNKGIDFDNANNVIYLEEEKKSRLTTGWIVFFAVLFVVAILTIVFWKKIWKWIKGEREQEKKVKEQLDIF